MPLHRVAKVVSICCLCAGVAACSVAPDGAGIHDPYEAQNRRVHDFNKGLDRAVLRPAANTVTIFPTEITDRVVNFANNSGLPGMVVNGLLQGDIGGATTNTLRFLINTTVGVGGMFDPAAAIGLQEDSTDFGQTMQVWGLPEGAYLELPGLGPSTQRDAAGRLVDFVLNPIDRVGTPPQRDLSTGAFVAEQVIDRGRFGDTVDSILYESADSYAQTRLLYLQSRRFELGLPAPDAYVDDCGNSADPLIDPFADPFSAPAPADCTAPEQDQDLTRGQ